MVQSDPEEAVRNVGVTATTAAVAVAVGVAAVERSQTFLLAA